MQYIGDDPLIHYGVLGMKWGVRKDGKPQGFQYGKESRRARKKKDANKTSTRYGRQARAKKIVKNTITTVTAAAAVAGAVYAGREIVSRIDSNSMNSTVNQVRNSFRKSASSINDRYIKQAHDILNKASSTKVSDIKSSTEKYSMSDALKTFNKEFGTGSTPKKSGYSMKDAIDTFNREFKTPAKTSRPSIPSSVSKMEKLAPGITKAYENMRENIIGPGSKEAADKYNELANKYYTEHFKVRENYLREQNRR